MNERRADARELFQRLLALSNDPWLYSEEYDVAHRRLIGNFPQAFTHLTLVQAAKTLAAPTGEIVARYPRPRPTVDSHP